MQRRQRCKRSVVVMLFCVMPALAHAATTWITLRPGFEYTKLQVGTATDEHFLHAFRIDLQAQRIESVLAKDFQITSASIRELAQRAHATLAINGGFFSPDFQPLGVRVQNGVLRTPFKNTSWWGVFIIEDRKARVVAARDFRFNPRMTFAVQAGPRLLVDRQIPPLKSGVDDRSALCITASGRVVIVVTEHAPMETAALAERLRRPERDNGLACVHALNLDGGHSAQLFATLGRFQLHVPNFSTLADAIIVRPR